MICSSSFNPYSLVSKSPTLKPLPSAHNPQPSNPQTLSAQTSGTKIKNIHVFAN